MLTVNRKEIKYIIACEKFFLLENQLQALMDYDKHAGNRGYMVRSLYFDSISNRDLFDKLEGLEKKKKIRLRIYSHLDKKVKLECKCKNGSDVQKYSLEISKDQALKMIEGEYTFLQKIDKPLARTLYDQLISGGYSPKTIVEYNRVAYTYPVSDVRICYDSNIKATMTPFGFFDKYPNLFSIMPLDRGVLEVKYNDFLPGSIKDSIKSMDESLTANSKYAQARFL
jgi:hypothetical protein